MYSSMQMFHNVVFLHHMHAVWFSIRFCATPLGMSRRGTLYVREPFLGHECTIRVRCTTAEVRLHCTRCQLITLFLPRLVAACSENTNLIQTYW